MNKDYIELLQDENTGEFYEPYATIVCKTEEDFKNMQEALEKQVAKKVIDKYTRYDADGEYDGDFCDCPNCKREIIDGFNLGEDYNYCVHCGQKLDWSEADENKEVD